MSSTVNPVVDSPVLIAIAIAAVFVDAEFDTVLELTVAPGLFASTVWAELSVRVVKAELVLPAASVSMILTGVAPPALSVLPSATV